MKKQRTNYSPEEKVGILKRHFVENTPVSDLCERYGMHPNVFYRWQKEFFENGAKAFERKSSRPSLADKKRIEYLEAKLTQKNEVLSELMEEYVALKKSLGEL